MFQQVHTYDRAVYEIRWPSVSWSKIIYIQDAHIWISLNRHRHNLRFNSTSTAACKIASNKYSPMFHIPVGYIYFMKSLYMHDVYSIYSLPWSHFHTRKQTGYLDHTQRTESTPRRPRDTAPRYAIRFCQKWNLSRFDAVAQLAILKKCQCEA